MLERNPNKIGRNSDPSRERSNKHSPVRATYLIVAKEVEESSNYIHIYIYRQIDETIPSEFVPIEASTLIFILE